MLSRLSFGLIIASMLTIGACQTIEVENNPNELESAHHAIIDGIEVTNNTKNAVAVYRMKLDENDNWYWWPRPCSGRVLNPNEHDKKVLTARHCVTSKSGITKPIVPPDRLRITAALDPGPPDPNPPSYAKTPYKITAYPNPQNHEGDDLAIVHVQGDIDLPDNVHQVGFNLAPTSSLVSADRVVTHQGYGWGTKQSDPMSGATSGVLRQALLFDLTSSSSSYRRYTYDNHGYPSGTQLIHGDSGGPSLLQQSSWTPEGGYVVAYIQPGVHSTISQTGDTGNDSAIAENWDWIQEQLQYIHLRSLAFPERKVQLTSLSKKKYVYTRKNNDSWGRPWLKYSPNNKRIAVLDSSAGDETGMCLDLKWNDPYPDAPLWLWSCTGSNAQRFIVTQDAHIMLEAHQDTNLCVTETNGNQLRLQICDTNERRQIWIWDYDPGVYPYTAPLD